MTTFGYTLDEVARFRPPPELEIRASRLVTEIMQSYSQMLDVAALLLLTHDCRDIARVQPPSGRDEFWVDAPTDRTRVGDLMPGRCVYRQWMHVEGGTMSIATEWLDPALAEAAGRAVTQ